jgi:hypothetical protein
MDCSSVVLGCDYVTQRGWSGAAQFQPELLSQIRESEGCVTVAEGSAGRSVLDYTWPVRELSAADLAAAADALITRAALRVQATAVAALKMGDLDGAYVAAYDAYRMAAESLLARQGLRATSGDGSHVAVEDAVSAQFAAEISAFVKPTFERFRRTRHSAQYFDPSAAPITKPDAAWAIEKATAAVAGVRVLLSESPLGRFD